MTGKCEQATSKLLQDINTADCGAQLNKWGSDILQRGPLSVMSKIRTTIEAARVTDEKRENQGYAGKEQQRQHDQDIYLHGDGRVNASLTGDVVAQWASSDADLIRSVQSALSELRSNLRSPCGSIETDEALGLVAGAEKAASQGDENRMLSV